MKFLLFSSAAGVIVFGVASKLSDLIGEVIFEDILKRIRSYYRRNKLKTIIIYIALAFLLYMPMSNFLQSAVPRKQEPAKQEIQAHSEEKKCNQNFNLRLDTAFFVLIILFSLIGAMRGWRREVMVMFSITLALFIIQVIQTYVAPVSRLLSSENPRGQFCLWSLLILIFILFGYHIPELREQRTEQKNIASQKRAGARLQDWLPGAIIGACNGYMIFGTIWSYLHMADYPFPDYVIGPTPGTPAGDAALKLITWLPPAWIGMTESYFAVAIGFAVIVILI